MEAPCHAVMIQKKMVLGFWKMKKREMEKCVNQENVHENNGTYFNLNKWIFVLQFTVLLYR